MNTHAPIRRVLLALLALVLPAVASAQTRDTEPYDIVVTADAAPLRAGDFEHFYKVAELPEGTILTVRGESEAWRRVDYPAGVHVAVRADEADLDGSVVRLTKPSRLRALNLTAGLAGSWKSAMPAPLPEGTTLTFDPRADTVRVRYVAGDDAEVLYDETITPDT